MLNSKIFLRFTFVLVVVTACLPETKDYTPYRIVSTIQRLKFSLP